MKPLLSQSSASIFLAGLAPSTGCIMSGLAAPEPSRSTKPVFLYSRYFNAEGEKRYLPDGTYSDVSSKPPV